MSTNNEKLRNIHYRIECMKNYILFLFVVATTVSAETYYPRKIVMEEETGTWCGWCVRGIETIERMHTKYPDNFIAIALHTSDRMSNPENYSELTARLTSVPSCFFNRSTSESNTVDLSVAERVITRLKHRRGCYSSKTIQI